jgi:hypothetical protein
VRVNRRRQQRDSERSNDQQDAVICSHLGIDLDLRHASPVKIADSEWQRDQGAATVTKKLSTIHVLGLRAKV